jgi:hypothetical protein
LERVTPGLDVPLWLVLDRLDDYFEVTDGWAAAPNVSVAREQTQSLIEDYANDHGVVDPGSLSTSVGMPTSELSEWLAWCGYLSYQDKILARTRSAGDHAAAILSVAGAPLTVDDIHASMGLERSIRTVANALGEDERFTRTDRTSWGLKEWEIGEYRGIRQEIDREIEASGGEIALNELIISITSRFDVSAASVQTYSASGDYETCRGVVRRREKPQAGRKSPADTRRMFRHDTSWRLRITVTSDHLRGSGFPLPTGVATLLGCEQGEVVELSSRLGNQPIRWTGPQPSCGTIKRFLDVLEAQEGSVVFLEFGPNRSFDITTSPTFGTGSLAQAVALTGAAGSEDDNFAAVLAVAVGLRADAKPRHILAAYHRRGDEDIAALLEEAWTRRTSASTN